MTKYVIELDGRLWVLRRFGRHDTMASGPTAESVREQAFDILRGGHAPCSLVIVGTPRYEWRLGSDDGEWEQVEP